MDPAYTNKTILIVEDESPMLHALKDTFMQSGFKVLEARDGSTGLGIAMHEKLDAILLDIILPVMDGLTMLRKLREDGEFGKNVPVILLTNLSADSDAINAAITQNNPAYYLVKTNWSMADVVDKVKECLRLN
jgi:DNA-binding response OmpR family regulator